ncbi:MAG: hypothetical protein NUW02_03215 [Candidatus Campbellbacteria bacterium]|nr:hypothetical protein [Candidatus Campbellbacteria bacterium]
MDIETLSKMQIILLTLLVSFVTSIATGIATVSLIEKAPVDVMRVIDRIIEKPIETFIPGEKEVITKTVVVQENELIAQAIETIRPSIVRLYEIGRTKNTFVAFGIVTDEVGTMLSSSASFKSKETYLAMRDDGVSTKVIAGTSTDGISTFTIDPAQEGEVLVFKPAPHASIVDLRLGQTIVALSGNESFTISPGVVTNITLPTPENQTGMGLIKTTIDTAGMALGTPLMTNRGEIVGIVHPTELGLFRTIFSTSL